MEVQAGECYLDSLFTGPPPHMFPDWSSVVENEFVLYGF